VLDQLHLLGEWDVQLHDTPDKYYHYTIHPKISVYITFLPSEAVDSTDSDDDTDDVADRVVGCIDIDDVVVDKAMGVAVNTNDVVDKAVSKVVDTDT
jgi:hypothetical protein